MIFSVRLNPQWKMMKILTVQLFLVTRQEVQVYTTNSAPWSAADQLAVRYHVDILVTAEEEEKEEEEKGSSCVLV